MPSLNPYLSFKANAREAMEFYKSVLGGDLEITTFEDFPDMAPVTERNLVMHSQLTTTAGFVLMASDTPDQIGFRQPVGVQIAISGDDEQTLRGYYDGLATGGVITMPLEKAPWGGLFGMCQDQYGVEWMISVETEDRSDVGAYTDADLGDGPETVEEGGKGAYTDADTEN